mmetsp:Transcript_27586/g.38793  ORF Transcript_27586/g.38793 Transcript_27586/m.38793 type:complete len:94 (+) Transcript_27586:103-384(+)
MGFLGNGSCVKFLNLRMFSYFEFHDFDNLSSFVLDALLPDFHLQGFQDDGQKLSYAQHLQLGSLLLVQFRQTLLMRHVAETAVSTMLAVTTCK